MIYIEWVTCLENSVLFISTSQITPQTWQFNTNMSCPIQVLWNQDPRVAWLRDLAHVLTGGCGHVTACQGWRFYF